MNTVTIRKLAIKYKFFIHYGCSTKKNAVTYDVTTKLYALDLMYKYLSDYNINFDFVEGDAFNTCCELIEEYILAAADKNESHICFGIDVTTH